ncbi:EAL domain-containing protein, partial [Enterobacter roggenkampii]
NRKETIAPLTGGILESHLLRRWSFTFTLADSPQNQSVVEKIIDLGKAYSMAVTAEGVETTEQLSFLKKNRCDEVQGYLLGKPAAITELNLNANRIDL